MNVFGVIFYSECSAQQHQPVQPAAHPDHDHVQPPLSLQEQLDASRQEIERLTQENTLLKVSRFGLQRFQNDPKLLNFYTGFKVSKRERESVSVYYYSIVLALLI